MPFNVDDEVYVPRSILGLDANSASPFQKTKILTREGRSARVSLPDGTPSELISVQKLSDFFGVLIIRIGDFAEDGLLDPLAKSVLNYLRMLLPGDTLRLVELRTVSEFERLWSHYHGMCKQVVVVAHGYESGIVFGDEDVPTALFREILEAPRPSAKEFLGLACKVGQAKVGKELSKSSAVSHFIGPLRGVHGCVSAAFASTFLHERLLAHYSARVSFKHARRDLVGAVPFRLWENGTLIEGEK